MNRLVVSAFVAVVLRLQALKTGTLPGIDWPVACSGLLHSIGLRPAIPLQRTSRSE
jgi:hypothetical protein